MCIRDRAGYAVHSAKQKAKDNVSDFKRGVVEERENRQEHRTQKRNQHRENISQKKQELQKAQEARQTVHALSLIHIFTYHRNCSDMEETSEHFLCVHGRFYEYNE